MKVLETHCYLYDTKLEELGIEPKEESVLFCVRVQNIESAREAFSDSTNELDKEHCVISTSNGESFKIKTPYETIKKLISE